jgi:tetratricopeptide (TPR) repeat protein
MNGDSQDEKLGVQYSPKPRIQPISESVVDSRRWHQKKRYRIPAGAVVILAALVIYAILNAEKLPSSESIHQAISEKEYDKALGLLDEAEAFEENTGIGFDSDWIQAERGYIYLQTGEFELAIANLTASIDGAPDNPSTFQNRGLAFERSGDHENAVADFTSAISLDPSNYIRFRERGMLYYNTGRPELAIADFNRAIELAPDVPDLLFKRAYAFNDAGNPNAAIRDANQLLKMAPENPRGYLARGVAEIMLGNFEVGLSDLDSALALDAPEEMRVAIETMRASLIE